MLFNKDYMYINRSSEGKQNGGPLIGVATAVTYNNSEANIFLDNTAQKANLFMVACGETSSAEVPVYTTIIDGNKTYKTGTTGNVPLSIKNINYEAGGLSMSVPVAANNKTLAYNSAIAVLYPAINREPDYIITAANVGYYSYDSDDDEKNYLVATLNGKLISGGQYIAPNLLIDNGDYYATGISTGNSPYIRLYTGSSSYVSTSKVGYSGDLTISSTRTQVSFSSSSSKKASCAVWLLWKK